MKEEQRGLAVGARGFFWIHRGPAADFKNGGLRLAFVPLLTCASEPGGIIPLSVPAEYNAEVTSLAG